MCSNLENHMDLPLDALQLMKRKDSSIDSPNDGPVLNWCFITLFSWNRHQHSDVVKEDSCGSLLFGVIWLESY